jgi:hypothetical protein
MALDAVGGRNKTCGKHHDESSSDMPTSCPARGVASNSFDPNTLVLMADGSRKPIKDVKLGDKVWPLIRPRGVPKPARSPMSARTPACALLSNSPSAPTPARDCNRDRRAPVLDRLGQALVKRDRPQTRPQTRHRRQPRRHHHRNQVMERSPPRLQPHHRRPPHVLRRCGRHLDPFPQLRA